LSTLFSRDNASTNNKISRLIPFSGYCLPPKFTKGDKH
jgi:hypothetical protein